MNDANSGANITRRELVGSLVLLGMFGATAQHATSAAGQEATGGASYEKLRQVLIERLVNTHYSTGPDGSIQVLPGDEVWPGQSGGAYHADWLFNDVTGLASDPRQALEDSIVAQEVHGGIVPGTDLSLVQQIVENAKALGLFDEGNLVYQVMREKMSVEAIGARTQGVKMFREWALANSEFTAEQQEFIDAAAASYMNVAWPHDDGHYY